MKRSFDMEQDKDVSSVVLMLLPVTWNSEIGAESQKSLLLFYTRNLTQIIEVWMRFFKKKKNFIIVNSWWALPS